MKPRIVLSEILEISNSVSRNGLMLECMRLRVFHLPLFAIKVAKSENRGNNSGTRREQAYSKKETFVCFCGKPIISYSIETALGSTLFDQVLVSTDDEEIATVSRQYGATVDEFRPSEFFRTMSLVYLMLCLTS